MHGSASGEAGKVDRDALAVEQHGDVFPKGALVMGVEPITKFQTAEDKANGRALEPETDKVTGSGPCW